MYADTLHVVDDAYIDSKLPQKNFGGHKAIRLRNGGKYDDQNGYVRFDLPSLPAGVTGDQIDKATLRMWVSGVYTEGFIQLYLIEDDWQENTLTANSASASDKSGRLFDFACSDLISVTSTLLIEPILQARSNTARKTTSSLTRAYWLAASSLGEETGSP